MELHSTTIRCNDKPERIADSTVLNLKREPSSVDPGGGKKNKTTRGRRENRRVSGHEWVPRGGRGERAHVGGSRRRVAFYIFTPRSPFSPGSLHCRRAGERTSTRSTPDTPSHPLGCPYFTFKASPNEATGLTPSRLPGQASWRISARNIKTRPVRGGCSFLCLRLCLCPCLWLYVRVYVCEHTPAVASVDRTCTRRCTGFNLENN